MISDRQRSRTYRQWSRTYRQSENTPARRRRRWRGRPSPYENPKARLEVSSSAEPVIRTHGNPFGFSNVASNRPIPLSPHHPLVEELAEMRHQKEQREHYWAGMRRRLPEDMNNPGSYDYQRWLTEQRTFDTAIEDLVRWQALAECGLPVVRETPPQSSSHQPLLEMPKERWRERHQNAQESVIWTDDRKSEAVGKWMDEMGAESVNSCANLPLFVGGASCGIRSSRDIGVDRINQAPWSLEEEMCYEEAEANRAAERVIAGEDQARRNVFFNALIDEMEASSSAESAASTSRSVRTLSPPPAAIPQPSPPLQIQRIPEMTPVTYDESHVIATATWKGLQERKRRNAEAEAQAQRASGKALTTQDALISSTSNPENTLATSDREKPSQMVSREVRRRPLAADWMDIDESHPAEILDLQDVECSGTSDGGGEDYSDDETESPGSEENDISSTKSRPAAEARSTQDTQPVKLSGRVVHVGNLTFETNEHHLEEVFSDYQVESVIIPRDEVQGRSFGYAFVIMTSASEAESAIADSDDMHIDYRRLTARLGNLPQKFAADYKPPERVHVAGHMGRNNRSQTYSSSQAELSDSQMAASQLARRRLLYDDNVNDIAANAQNMMDNPRISLKELTHAQRRQHRRYVQEQLSAIEDYLVRREDGHKLSHRQIKLVNRQEDFAQYLKELESFSRE